MERTPIGKLRENLGKKVTIQGWLQTLRDQKKMQFLVMRDPSGACQVVFEKAADPALADLISTLSSEACLTISGTAIDNPVVKLGGLEMQLESLEVNNAAVSPLPLDPFAEVQPAIDFRLDWRYLDLRRPEISLIFKVQTTLEMAMREYWIKNGYIEIHTPKLTGSPSEGGAELFELPYFDRKAYLAQSPQLYKQMAMAAGFEKVFEIGPAFRADPSFTSRHMTEFTSIDMEISWIDSHDDVMREEENMLRYAYQHVKDAHGDAIKELMGVDLQVPEVPFPRLTMAETIEILKSEGYKVPPEKKGDIDPAGERLIGQYVKERMGSDFVFIIDWPITVRPFYHMRHADHPNLTKSFDLIASGLEITTGAQREHRYDVLARQAGEKGVSLETIQSYVDSFKYGMPPHGGLGLGLSRLLMVMLGLNNVREAVFLFRGPNRLHP
jgi:aspartyl-tRNA synthetase